MLKVTNFFFNLTVQSANGANFTPLRSNLVDILPIDKPSYKRSTKPLSRIAIADLVGPKESKNENFTISDEDIDKLFNSNCGNFEEIKGPVNKANLLNKAANVPKETKKENQEKLQETKTDKAVASPKTQDSNKIAIETINTLEVN